MCLFILVGAAAAAVNGCTGDQFRQGQLPPEGGAGGSAGGAGAAGKATAGAGGAQAGAGGSVAGGSGAGGTVAGAAGSSGATAAGSAGTSGAGAGGAASAGGGGGAGGGSGAAGKAGNGGAAGKAGAAGNGGAGGSGPVETAPAVTSTALFASGCSGAKYDDGGGKVEAPQGAGTRCLVIGGDVKAGDTVDIDGKALAPTFDAVAKTLTVQWDVPHGGGETPSASKLTVGRGSLISTPTSLAIVPRQLDSSKSGDAGGLGNKARPFATLAEALGETKSGDWIAVTKLEQIPAPIGAATGVAVPSGVTIAAKTGVVPVKTSAQLQLAAGTRVRGLEIDCSALGATVDCVVAGGAGVVLEQTSLLDIRSTGISTTGVDTTVSVIGGKLEGTKPIRITTEGAELHVKEATIVVPKVGGGPSIEMIDTASATQRLFLDAGSKPTVFGGATARSAIRAKDVRTVELRSVEITGGANDEEAAIDVRGAITEAKLFDVDVLGSLGEGVHFQGKSIAFDGTKIAAAIGTSVFVDGGATRIDDLEIQNPKGVGFVSTKTDKVEIPGKLLMEWLPEAPPVLFGLRFYGELEVTGSAIFNHPPSTAIYVSEGAKLNGAGKNASTGIRIHDAIGVAITVEPGTQVTLAGGGISRRAVVADNSQPLLQILSFVKKTSVTLDEMQISFEGSDAVPTPAAQVFVPPGPDVQTYPAEVPSIQYSVPTAAGARLLYKMSADANSVALGSGVQLRYKH